MDIEKTQNIIRAIKNGASEEAVIKEYKLKYEDLYAAISYVDQSFARESLKHFCAGCANDICFSWPMRDETPCPVRGYKPHCPLKK